MGTDWEQNGNRGEHSGNIVDTEFEQSWNRVGTEWERSGDIVGKGGKKWEQTWNR